MRYEDFFKIARYMNENWKGGYTKAEYTQLAKEYFEDYQWTLTKRNEEKGFIEHTILCLIDGLCEDWANGNIEPVKWIKQMMTELEFEPMDFKDCENTTIYLVDFIKKEMM
ncbi:hypothetical protein [uncultured Eubacterium sp.]|uniref:hypothetical protein n=1 Tax=uncultured Eubacterium sp. TaxID=165185 RepID=UPI0026383539|nr:hypothetical protein [uncultured Eubacterium sp.]